MLIEILCCRLQIIGYSDRQHTVLNSLQRVVQEVDAAHASDILNDLAIELTSQLNQLKTVEQQVNI